jgi:hypothetical protein
MENTAPTGEFATTVKIRTRRPLLRGFVCVAAVATFAVGLGGSAYGAEDTGSTDGSVEVTAAITLTGLPAGFTLAGIPGATVSTGATPVTFNVETNNIGGYAVTVQGAAATLTGVVVGNTDSIPIGALSVRETTIETIYTPLSSTVAVPVHSQTDRSAEGGDDLSNDYQVVIPFVSSDTYTVTLDYVATTL